MFETEKIWPISNLSKSTAHSGGAIGSDVAWEKIGMSLGLSNVKHYSYKTPQHRSPYKIEIEESDFLEGHLKVLEANEKILKRRGIEKYMNLLARNWAQVKYSDSVYAVGRILFRGDTGAKGRTHTQNCPIVDGGTGYAVAMGVLADRPIWVYDQERNGWYCYDTYEETFKRCTQMPWIITNEFAAIGTRQIKQNGLEAIELIYRNTLKKYNQTENDS
jgi:hypothetical protein